MCHESAFGINKTVQMCEKNKKTSQEIEFVQYFMCLRFPVK